MAASGPRPVAVAPLTASGSNRTADGLQTRLSRSAHRGDRFCSGTRSPRDWNRADSLAVPLAAARSLGAESGRLTVHERSGLNRQRPRPPPRPALRIARASQARRLPCLARKAEPGTKCRKESRPGSVRSLEVIRSLAWPSTRAGTGVDANTSSPKRSPASKPSRRSLSRNSDRPASGTAATPS